jgi:hypothetical protein
VRRKEGKGKGKGDARVLRKRGEKELQKLRERKRKKGVENWIIVTLFSLTYATHLFIVFAMKVCVRRERKGCCYFFHDN